MNSDSAFLIGATHAVCQDYAVAGIGSTNGADAAPDFKSRPYVILSDGCSSSPDTDIGARLLVKAAEQVLHAAGQPPEFDPAALHREAARRALVWARRAGLRAEAIDATLLTAHVCGDTLVVGCSGDGVVCFESRAGTLDVYVISYASGYPVYPAYTHQPERLRALADMTRAGDKEVKRFRRASVAEPLRLESTTQGGSLTEVFAVKAANYRFAALLSDGVHSFYVAQQTPTSKRVEAVSLDTVLGELIAFKSVRGLFVGRRVRRFVKDCEAKGWQHADDLALGALHLGD